MIAIPDPNGRLGLPADLKIREERLRQLQARRALLRMTHVIRVNTVTITKLGGATDAASRAMERFVRLAIEVTAR